MTSLRSRVKLTLMKKLSLYIFLGLMFCNTTIAKDLNGTKLYCYKQEGDPSSQLGVSWLDAALVFIENNKVKLSYMNSDPKLGIVPHDLMIEQIFNYEVSENNIIIKTSVTSKFFNTDTKLNRKNLSLNADYFSIPCEIVDYDPSEKFFKKYEKIKSLMEEKNENKI